MNKLSHHDYASSVFELGEREASQSPEKHLLLQAGSVRIVFSVDDRATRKTCTGRLTCLLWVGRLGILWRAHQRCNACSRGAMPPSADQT